MPDFVTLYDQTQGNNYSLQQPKTIFTRQVPMNGLLNSPVNLPNIVAVNGAVIKASPLNSGTIYIGDSISVTSINDGTGNSFPLDPGESAPAGCVNLNAVWALGAAGDFLTIIGS